MENKEYIQSKDLKEEFETFKANPRLEPFVNEILKSGFIEKYYLSTLYDKMVTIQNSVTQYSALLYGSDIKKIWSTIYFLTKRNTELEVENSKLKSQLKQINEICKS